MGLPQVEGRLFRYLIWVMSNLRLTCTVLVFATGGRPAPSLPNIRLPQDWAQLLRSLDVEPGPLLPPSRKRTGQHRPGTLMSFAQRRSQLNDEERAFVRDVLYPWDLALYRWACPPTTTANADHLSIRRPSYEWRTCALVRT